MALAHTNRQLHAETIRLYERAHKRMSDYRKAFKIEHAYKRLDEIDDYDWGGALAKMFLCVGWIMVPATMALATTVWLTGLGSLIWAVAFGLGCVSVALVLVILDIGADLKL